MGRGLFEETVIWSLGDWAQGGYDCGCDILEPADLWLEYIEPAFRDRAMRVEEGIGLELECWSVDRRPIAFFSVGRG